MITHDDIEQGSPEWLALRMTHFTASEAPAMMSVSPYMTRTALLDMKKSGASLEVTPHQQKLFDKGHAAEAAAREIIEREIGEDLYPVVGSLEVDGLPLLASFDGLTMLGELGFEHKLWNTKKAEQVMVGQVPDSDVWQLEQQLLVSDADEILYVVSDGTDEQRVSLRYVSNAAKRKQLIEGWKQFRRDLETHEISRPIAQVLANEQENLPALLIQVAGQVTASNLPEFKAVVSARVKAINTDLVTDQDFADADSAVKFLTKAEKALADARDNALNSTASIAEILAALGSLKDEMRAKRLKLDKLVKEQKQSIKRQIAVESNEKLAAMMDELNASISPYSLPIIVADATGAMKGKSSLDSIRDAVATDRAQTEQEAHRLAAHIMASAKIIARAEGYDALFPDRESLALKDHDDLKATITARILEHKMAEEKRIEAAKLAERQSPDSDVWQLEQPAQQKPAQHKLDREFQQPAITEFQQGYLAALRDHNLHAEVKRYTAMIAA